jgi:hypothetical protein
MTARRDLKPGDVFRYAVGGIRWRALNDSVDENITNREPDARWRYHAAHSERLVYPTPRERPVILYRDFDIDEAERAAMHAHFLCTDSRMAVKEGDLVIGRFSVLPFYAEQERDLAKVGARLINTKAQHDYIADIGNWYGPFAALTPRTWRLDELPTIPETPHGYVLKGATNSKKFLWDTHMFAPNRAAIGDVLQRLLDDTLISTQSIYIREYVPLVSYTVGLHGLPVTKEFRLFIAYGEVVSAGFYWASHAEDVVELVGRLPTTEEIPAPFLQSVLSQGRAADLPFVVVDVAQAVNGEWIVVELNDAQQSGLSMNDPDTLYRNLRGILARR